MERQPKQHRGWPLILGLVWVIAAAGCASGPETTAEMSAAQSPAAASEEGGDEKASEPTPPEGFSDAEVLKVVSTRGGHAVILGDGEQKRVVPIFVGQSQAMAIELRLQRRRYSRPLTHDLLDDIVAKLGGDIVKVHIDAVKNGVFVGTVYVRGDGKTHEIDARSSDAIALAVGKDAPIFVAESIFEKVGVSRDKFEEGGVPGRNPYGKPPKKPPEKKPGESEESEDRPFY